MPLNLPNLDDLSWDDLMKEGRSLIPAWAPEWTNHNPSDPGITLVELFAYFSEKLMYRLNRVGDKNVEEFLKLINGPEWRTQGPKFLLDEKRETVQAMRKLRRAVTAADFEDLSCSVWGVARAKCVARRNLESSEPDARTAEAPGHISVVILADTGSQPSPELLAKVKHELEPARMLTTRLHIVAPRYLSLMIRLTIVPQRGVRAEKAQQAAIEGLQRFFDPRRGGMDEKGWQFGGNVYVSDIYRVLLNLPEIENVMPARDSAGKVLDVLGIETGSAERLRRNSRGEIEAVVLRPDELVEAPAENVQISLPSQV